MIKRWGGVFIAGLALLGCGKSEYLYHLKDIPVQNFEGIHKLKELQGETKVDILWVIDNSGSMGNYQKELQKNADLFINDFVTKGGLEWKMGILSSTLADEPYVGFTPTTILDYKTKDAVSIFKDAVKKLGTYGDVTEKFFAPIEKHLGKYPDFNRKQSTLAMIFVTDAPEQSRMPAAEFMKVLTKAKGDLKRTILYGVFASVDFGCQYTDEYWNYAGSPYEEVINATKGKVYKLCNTDFGKNLSDLGKDLVERIKRPFIQLKDRPVVSSVRVTHNGKDLPAGLPEQKGWWTYNFDLNRIVFNSLDFAPGDNESVTVHYAIADEVVR